MVRRMKPSVQNSRGVLCMTLGFCLFDVFFFDKDCSPAHHAFYTRRCLMRETTGSMFSVQILNLPVVLPLVEIEIASSPLNLSTLEVNGLTAGIFLLG